MKSILVYLSLVAFCKASASISRAISGKIVNGGNTKLTEVPYIVSLQTVNNFHFCGGSIIDKNHVITTAACVQGKQASDIKIVADTVDLDDPKAIYFASDIVIHEKYNEADSWVNDIAIIKVSVPFELSESSYAPLAHQELPTGTWAYLYGWGRLEAGGESPKRLQGAGVYIINDAYCRRDYQPLGYTIYSTQNCAKGWDIGPNVGSCHGDGGGPLIGIGKLIGLISWSKGCGSTKYATIYTKVAEYIDWIEANKL